MTMRAPIAFPKQWQISPKCQFFFISIKLGRKRPTLHEITHGGGRGGGGGVVMGGIDGPSEAWICYLLISIEIHWWKTGYRRTVWPTDGWTHPLIGMRGRIKKKFDFTKRFSTTILWWYHVRCSRSKTPISLFLLLLSSPSLIPLPFLFLHSPPFLPSSFLCFFVLDNVWKLQCAGFLRGNSGETIFSFNDIMQMNSL